MEIAGGSAKKPATPPCVCKCGRKICVFKAVLAAGPIVCGICDTEFTPHETEDDEPKG